MKKLFKPAFGALAIALLMAGCKGNQSGSKPDSIKADSSYSVKNSSDSTLKTAAEPAAETSHTKTDTLSKIIPQKTETKKTVVKKNVQ
ncbi:MAG: hypothetical protein ACXVJD_06180 [Mucilaginibacter sp.]